MNRSNWSSSLVKLFSQAMLGLSLGCVAYAGFLAIIDSQVSTVPIPDSPHSSVVVWGMPVETVVDWGLAIPLLSLLALPIVWRARVPSVFARWYVAAGLGLIALASFIGCGYLTVGAMLHWMWLGFD